MAGGVGAVDAGQQVAPGAQLIQHRQDAAAGAKHAGALVGGDLFVGNGLGPEGQPDLPLGDPLLVQRHDLGQIGLHIAAAVGQGPIGALARLVDGGPVGEVQQVLLVVEIVGDDGGAAASPLRHIPHRHRIQAGPGDEPHGHRNDLRSSRMMININWH